MYQSIQLNLTDSQYKNLSKGKSVNVSSSNVGSGHTVFLTQRQINKVQKNLGLGKGTRISLSQDQMDYNVQHGSGFRDWVKKGWNAVKDPVKNFGKTLVKNYGDQAIKIASNAANNLLDQGTLVASAIGPQKGLLGKVFQDTIKMGNKASQDQLLAILKGLKQTVNGSDLFELTPEASQHIDTLSGQGFFDDVLDVVSTPVKAVAGLAGPVVSNVAEKALAGLMTKALTGGGQKGKGFATDMLLKYGKPDVKSDIEKMLGNGVKRRGRPRKIGSGLLAPGQRVQSSS